MLEKLQVKEKISNKQEDANSLKKKLNLSLISLFVCLNCKYFQFALFCMLSFISFESLQIYSSQKMQKIDINMVEHKMFVLLKKKAFIVL